MFFFKTCRKAYVFVFLSLLVASSCQKSPNQSTQIVSDELQSSGVLFTENLPISAIDSFIELNRQKHQIPAVSIALIKDGAIVYSKNYGVVNAITKEPITQEAVFEAASITKPVFAYTVCRLAQKGVIDLDETLHERFSFGSLAEENPCYKEITVRHVLSHVSGLPNWGIEMIACPGEQFGYSGQGFEFLTKALAKSYTEVMDRKILAYLNEEVLTPFEMTNTYFVESPELTQLCVDGHLEGKPTEQTFPESPEMAFGMHCNAIDIAKFGIAMLQREGLNEQMANELFSIQTVVPDDEKEYNSDYEQGYSLGFYIRKSPHGKVFGHSGSNYDFKCLFEIYDDLKMGYVVMTNSDTGDMLNDEMAKFLIEGF